MTDLTMRGKMCLVSGATGGIGLATAIALGRMGADLVLVGRDAQRTEAAVKSVASVQPADARAEFLLADLSLPAEIQRAAHEFTARHGRLDVLVNNAGVTLSRRRETVDGIEVTFATNHLGYFCLTHHLLDTLRASRPARIVNVSSEVHRGVTLDWDDLQASKRWGGYKAYQRTKLANLLFTYELARRLEGSGVTVNAAAPGLVRTNLGLGDGGLAAWGKRFANRFMGVDPEAGCQTVVYLASSPEVEGVSGQYFRQRTPLRSSDASYNRGAAARLWRTSLELAGLTGEDVPGGTVDRMEEV